jgi:hypothetical protein
MSHGVLSNGSISEPLVLAQPIRANRRTVLTNATPTAIISFDIGDPGFSNHIGATIVWSVSVFAATGNQVMHATSEFGVVSFGGVATIDDSPLTPQTTALAASSGTLTVDFTTSIVGTVVTLLVAATTSLATPTIYFDRISLVPVPVTIT